MALLLLTLAAGTVVGYARRGRLRRLAADPPVRSRLVLTALGLGVVGVLGGWLWQPLLPALTGACWLVLAYYAWLNRRRHGAALLSLGLMLNGLAILLNGGMPVSTAAAAHAGVESSAIPADQVVPTDQAALPWLGKVVPIALPPHPEVVSPGDIAIAAGAAAFLAGAMTSRRRDLADNAQRATERPSPTRPQPTSPRLTA